MNNVTTTILDDQMNKINKDVKASKPSVQDFEKENVR
jgi:hypothetical protein